MDSCGGALLQPSPARDTRAREPTPLHGYLLLSPCAQLCFQAPPRRGLALVAGFLSPISGGRGGWPVWRAPALVGALRQDTAYLLGRSAVGSLSLFKWVKLSTVIIPAV